MVDDVELGHVNLEVLQFSVVIFIPLVLHIRSLNANAE